LLDSGCSNHITGEKELFTSLELHDIPKETIVFGDNSKGDVIDLGKIALSNDNSISNVYLVETSQKQKIYIASNVLTEHALLQ
jgi:hypothetical protein